MFGSFSELFYRPSAYLSIIFKLLFPALALIAVFSSSGCGNEKIVESPCADQEISPINGTSITTTPAVRIPIEPYMVKRPMTGDRYIYENNITVDISNVESGYIMLRYTGDASKVVIQIKSTSSPLIYTFNLDVNGNWEVFPLTMGDGTYTVNILEHVEGQMFAVAMSTTFNVVLENEKLPFLYPNQFVNFNENSKATALAAELAKSASSELDVVRRIYEFVINNITYDYIFAEMVVSGQITHHVPDLDATLASGRGICFDYASLMAGMLRAQHIPAKLITGYVSGGIFHAWINVYILDIGWINAIHFDGMDWALMDPTFSAAFNSAGNIAGFVGIGSNHSPLFIH